MNERIFVSSVQKEFAGERRAIRDFVRGDALLRRFFDVFLFEDLPASDRRADDVYLEEVKRCDLYVGLFGYDYGREGAQEEASTEREFDHATAHGKVRLIFVKGTGDAGRQPRMRKLIAKAGQQLIRRRFENVAELTAALYASLVEYLEGRGAIQNRPFDERPCPEATLEDIETDAVARFVQRARHERQFPLPEMTPVADLLAHLNLLHGGQLTNGALLLFGCDPQQFIPAAEMRCMHFHGAEVQRPVPFYRIFKGDVFEQVDRATDFVLSVISRSVGTRAESAQVPVTYEIPPEAIREAIVNAVAHRDYALAGAVQVSVFSDRVEVWSPGVLPAPLTPERLRERHGSVARNARVCEALFLARYIEKYGTGTLMMIRRCRDRGLPEPDFEQRGGEFAVTLWRDWLTVDLLAGLGLNERQLKALHVARQERRLTNSRYREVTGASRPTAKRDLDDLVGKGLLVPKGAGRGAYYEVPSKRLINGSNGSPENDGENGS